MVIGRDLSSQRSLKVLILSTQRVIHVSSFKPIPLERTVVATLDEMAANDDENNEEEDPLSDEPEADTTDPLEPTVMDLARHQDYDDADLDEGLLPLQPLPPVHGKPSTTR